MQGSSSGSDPNVPGDKSDKQYSFVFLKSIRALTFSGVPEITDFELCGFSGSLETSPNHPDTLGNAPSFPQLRLQGERPCWAKWGRPSQPQGHIHAAVDASRRISRSLQAPVSPQSTAASL